MNGLPIDAAPLRARRVLPSNVADPARRENHGVARGFAGQPHNAAIILDIIDKTAERVAHARVPPFALLEAIPRVDVGATAMRGADVGQVLPASAHAVTIHARSQSREIRLPSDHPQ